MKPLALAMLEGLRTRFESVKAKKEYIIATMLHPKFKLNFLPDNEKLLHREMLAEYVKTVQIEVPSATAVTPSNSSSSISEGDNDDLYAFLGTQSQADTEVHDQVGLYPIIINVTLYYMYKLII